MNQPIVQSPDGVTLVGGGPVSRAELALALRFAPLVVAADGGADRVLAAGMMPAAVVGDFDSISAKARAAIPAERQHVISEQATTDFDKALRSVDAPFVLALGFTGARVDHGLAVLNGLVRQAGRLCLLIGPRDVVFHAPPQMELEMRIGDRLSLFPLAPVTGRSKGLEWPIDGIGFDPAGMIGTSNRVTARRVVIAMDGPGMLVILPRNRLEAALTALLPGWRAPAPAPGRPGVRGR